MPRSTVLRDVALLMLLACVTTTIAIAHKSMVMDEATSVLYARLPPGPLLAVVTGWDANMGLYYAALSVWWRLFGESETAVRSLSALSAVLAVGATYLVGRELFGRSAGAIAGALLALNSFIVTFAQTARSYSMVVLLTTLSSLFFVRELQRPSRVNRVAYVLTAALSFHAHYFAAFVLLAHAVTLLAVRRRGAFTRESAVTAAAVALLCLPEAVLAVHNPGESPIAWIDPASFADIMPVFVDLSGGHVWALVLLVAAGALGAATAWPHPDERWRWGFVAAWLVLPVGLSFVVSLAKPMFLSHYLIVCAPALVLFGSAGIERIRPRAVGVAALAVLGWVSVGQLQAYYRAGALQDWRAMTRHVLESAQPDDAVVFFPDGARKPFDYYVRRSGVQAPRELRDLHFDGAARVWFVIRESDLEDQATRYRESAMALASRYRLTDSRDFGWVRVDLYAR